MILGPGDIWKITELRKRILFTLMMLAVYRLGVFVSTPGIDVAALQRIFDNADGNFFGLVNMFSGGALENFSIFTLGIAPYITVSIIMQILVLSIPRLNELQKKEGEHGRRIITRYTRQATILLALFQGFAAAITLETNGLAHMPGWTFRISTMVTLTAGTAFIMWLGEQISERGIGNGASIVIFSGIVARMPEVLVTTIALSRTGEISPMSVLFILGFTLFLIAFIVFIERSYRRIPVQYPRRMVGRNVAQAQTQYMPFKLNLAGIMPAIFASMFFSLPTMLAGATQNEFLKDFVDHLNRASATYMIILVVLIIFFTYFYVGIDKDPVQLADDLKRNGGFVPNVRPGKQTADYLFGIFNRLSIWSALYIAFICVVPQAVYQELGATAFSYVFGGTAVLIVIGVTLDTASQIQSYILAKNYETFMAQNAKTKGNAGVGSRTRLIRR